MGLTYANIELINGDDFGDARRGRIGEDEVRNLTIHAMVDMGAIMLCINDNIKKALGLLRLIEHYENTLDATHVGGHKMIIFPKPALT